MTLYAILTSIALCSLISTIVFLIMIILEKKYSVSYFIKMNIIYELFSISVSLLSYVMVVNYLPILILTYVASGYDSDHDLIKQKVDYDAAITIVAGYYGTIFISAIIGIPLFVYIYKKIIKLIYRGIKKNDY